MSILKNHNINPDPLKDQFFLEDGEIIGKIVEFAELDKDDVVLEIGAGIGNLTAEMAKHAGRVIAFEIDKRFKPMLSKLPENVEMHFESAWNYVQLHGKFRKKKEYNKVVSNPPYSFIEPFLHNLTFLTYDKVILVVPKVFLGTLKGNGVFSSFFNFKILMEVPKEKFYPVPKSNSVVIELIKLPDPLEIKNPGLYLRQYIYQHEGQLVRNSLMEGILKYARLVHSIKVTKNQAREMIIKSGISVNSLEDVPRDSKIYFSIEEKADFILNDLEKI